MWWETGLVTGTEFIRALHWVPFRAEAPRLGRTVSSPTPQPLLPQQLLIVPNMTAAAEGMACPQGVWLGLAFPLLLPSSRGSLRPPFPPSVPSTATLLTQHTSPSHPCPSAVAFDA